MQFWVDVNGHGHYHWWLSAGGRGLADSGRSFLDRAGAIRAARQFRRSGATATYHVWEMQEHWYWDATAANGRKVATGGRPYASEHEAKRAADSVRRNAQLAGCP